uniref:Protein phosphatase 1 regulatory subunit 21 n=1 Tax=Parascaris univalens TaxID=6257 RepID=A0A915ASG1_PARUN
MSTISSNTDLNTKYHRVASEYAKLRAQIPVLKNAVLDEQAKTKRLTEEMHGKESALRKLEAENESLAFRNGQLLKRVEALQAEIDRAQQSPSGKKRAVSSQGSGRFEHSKIDSSLLEDELLVKVRENERLHSEIFELESARERDISAINEKCLTLQSENESLRIRLEQLLTSSANNHSLPRDAHTAERVSEIGSVSASASVESGVEDAEATSRVLVVDALRSGRTVLANFANLLRLLERRSTIYPNDMSIEILPESTKLYGSHLLKSGDLISESATHLEDLAQRVADDESFCIVRERRRLGSVIVDALNSISNWKELFAEGVSRENRLSWAGPNLCRCNDDWQSSFCAFLDSMLTLSMRIGDESDLSVHSFTGALDCLRALSLECGRVFAAKIFDENRIPTASKRLRCVNECIDKCIGSISRSIGNLSALLLLIEGTTNAASRKWQKNEVDARIVCDGESPSTADDDGSSKELLQGITAEQGDRQPSGSTVTAPQVDESDFVHDSLGRELECAASRVLELEKEKERILVEAELLRMKLATVSSASKEQSLGGAETDELELLGVYYEKRMGELLSQLQFMRSRANYYKDECDDLIRRTKVVLEEKEALATNLAEADRRIAVLTDDLEATRKGYEEQMRSLYEHLGELNARIEDQTETIASLRDASKASNGVTKQD